MIVIPLVMVSVISAILKLRGQANVGKIGATVLAVLLVTTAIAALVGALVTSSFGLTSAGLDKGQVETEQQAALEKSAATLPGDLPSQIAAFIASNPFLDMTGARSSSTVAVVVFSGFIGFGILQVGRKQKVLFERLSEGVDALQAVVTEIVKTVLRLTPFGILALVAKIVAGSNWAQMLKLVNFVLVSYLAIAIMFAIHFIILAAFGMSRLTYLSKAWSTLTFAFVSRSSAATLPLAVKTQTSRLGVPDAIANLGSSLAVTTGQNGCAGIYPAMLAVMVAPPWASIRLRRTLSSGSSSLWRSARSGSRGSAGARPTPGSWCSPRSVFQSGLRLCSSRWNR